MTKRQDEKVRTRGEPNRWTTYLIWALLCVGSLGVLVVESQRERSGESGPEHDATAEVAGAETADVEPARREPADIDAPIIDPGTSRDTPADASSAPPPPASDGGDMAGITPALSAEIVLFDDTATLVFRETPWIASDVGAPSDDSQDALDSVIMLDLPGGRTIPLRASQLWVGNPIELPAESLEDLERANYAMRLRTERFQVPIRAAAPPTTELVWQAVAGPYRVGDGRFRVPVRVHAREKTGDVLRAATAPKKTRFLIETPGTVAEPVEVTIEEGATRSDPALVLLRRNQTVNLIATALDDDTPPSELAISWRKHGPRSIGLEVKPTTLQGYATPAAVTRLSLRLLVDGRPTPWPTEPSVEAPPALHLEPQTVDLSSGTATLEAWAGTGVAGEIHFELPDLDLREAIPVRVSSPWKYLVIAALLGIVGLIVAKRQTLFVGRSRWRIALELLAALAGGSFLYFSYLTGWLPIPMDLLGEPQAGAVGILGGYVGDGVFLLVARVLRLVGRGTE